MDNPLFLTLFLIIVVAAIAAYIGMQYGRTKGITQGKELGIQSEKERQQGILQSAEEQAASGVSPNQVRISVGIEHIDDIKADLEQAFEKVFTSELVV